MTSRPESEQSTIDIAQIEKSFPAPPKSSHGFHKSLPPLPPMAEIKRDAAEAIASEEKTVAREAKPGDVLPARQEPEKNTALRLGESTMTGSAKLVPKEEPRPTTASTRRPSFVSVDPKRSLKYGVGKYATVELSPQPSEDPNDPLVYIFPFPQASSLLIELLIRKNKFRTGRCGREISTSPCCYP